MPLPLNTTTPTSQTLLTLTAGALLALSLPPLLSSLSSTLSASSTPSPSIYPAPRPSTSSPSSSPSNQQKQSGTPYPPNLLPGARDVDTPYGMIRVYEWGPEEGEKVLLVHGISTPCPALGDVAGELVERGGRRVMLFDLFGRGYTDAPNPQNHPYTPTLYTTQILHVLASSPLPWHSFHLIGYSLGGLISIHFTHYFPHLVRSLTLIAPAGLIRPHHSTFQSRLLYTSNWIPAGVLEWAVRKRMTPPAPKDPKDKSTEQILVGQVQQSRQTAEGEKAQRPLPQGGISKHAPGLTVSQVIAWQLESHPGYVPAFMSSLRECPIYTQHEEWKVIGRRLEEQRRGISSVEEEELLHAKVLMVVGKNDVVIVPDEVSADAKSILGEEGVEVHEFDAGHEVPMAKSKEVAETVLGFWDRSGI